MHGLPIGRLGPCLGHLPPPMVAGLRSEVDPCRDRDLRVLNPLYRTSASRSTSPSTSRSPAHYGRTTRSSRWCRRRWRSGDGQADLRVERVPRRLYRGRTRRLRLGRTGRRRVRVHHRPHAVRWHLPLRAAHVRHDGRLGNRRRPGRAVGPHERLRERLAGSSGPSSSVGASRRCRPTRAPSSRSSTSADSATASDTSATALCRKPRPLRPSADRVAKVSASTGSAPCDGHSVETELVALDVLHHDARLVVVIGRQ